MVQGRLQIKEKKINPLASNFRSAVIIASEANSNPPVLLGSHLQEEGAETSVCTQHKSNVNRAYILITNTLVGTYL